jgi:hypothetical protein
MAIHRNTGHLGRAGAPMLHVPSAIVIAGSATAGVLVTVYLVVAMSAAQPTVTNEPTVAPEAVAVAPAPVAKAAAPAGRLGAVAQIQTNVPDVDSQEFILQPVGIVPVSRTAVTAAQVSPSAFVTSTPKPGPRALHPGDVLVSPSGSRLSPHSASLLLRDA